MSKITLTTIKKFIKDNKEGLYIMPKSSFDGMVDCIMPIDSDWKKIDPQKLNFEDKYTYGINGTWFTPTGNLYSPYVDDVMVGYEVYNCCGSFLLAFRKK